MIEMDGSPPQLIDMNCEELLCQQYWYAGEMADEADVVWLKLAGRWYQLFFDSGVVHWREQEKGPEIGEGTVGDVLAYPLVDLGTRFGLKGRVVSGTSLVDTSEGEAYSLAFEQVGTLVFVNLGDRTQIRFRRA